MLVKQITPRRIAVVLMVVCLNNVVFIGIKKLKTMTTLPNDRRASVCTNFNSLYPARISAVGHSSGLPKIEKQKAIGLCINFNHNPDAHATALKSLLMYYTLIYQHVAILTPAPFISLSPANQAILKEYGVKAFDPLKPQSNGHTRINASEDFTGSLFHLGCTGTQMGYYQYLCASLCSQLFRHLADSRASAQLRGVLYLADDMFFNLTLTLTNPRDYSLDEFWITPGNSFIDGRKLTERSSAWGGWGHNDNFNRFQQIFFQGKAFSDVLSTLYGANYSIAAGLADIVYIPMADNQLSTLVDVVDKMTSIFPGVFSELIFPVLIDIAGALCGHWPYQHDRIYFNSKVNLLNNLTNMRNLEKHRRVLRARDPFNTREFILRPCLLNFGGAFWDSQRNSETLYRQAIFSNRATLTNTTRTERMEYVHPMKLSNNASWQYLLWREAMTMQIQKLQQYQLYCSSAHLI